MSFEIRNKLIKLLSAVTELEVALMMNFVFNNEFHEKWPETRKIFENNKIEPLFEDYMGLLEIEEEGELNMIKGMISNFLKNEPKPIDLDVLYKRVKKFQQELFEKFLKSI